MDSFFPDARETHRKSVVAVMWRHPGTDSTQRTKCME